MTYEPKFRKFQGRGRKWCTTENRENLTTKLRKHPAPKITAKKRENACSASKMTSRDTQNALRNTDFGDSRGAQRRPSETLNTNTNSSFLVQKLRSTRDTTSPKTKKCTFATQTPLQTPVFRIRRRRKSRKFRARLTKNVENQNSSDVLNHKMAKITTQVTP